MPECFETDEDYEIINDGSDLFIDILFLSEGQSPDFTLRVDGVEKIKHGKESVRNFLLKPDKELNGKVIKLYGNIADTSKTADDISMRVVVKGGVSDFTKDFSVTVSDEGETVEIDIIIRPYA